MVLALSSHISNQGFDAFLVVMFLATPVWVLAIYFFGGNALHQMRVNQLRPHLGYVLTVAALPVAVTLLLMLAWPPMTMSLLAALLLSFWLLTGRYPGSEERKQLTETGLYIAAGVLWWIFGLALIASVLSAWQVMALVFGIGFLSATAGLVLVVRRRRQLRWVGPTHVAISLAMIPVLLTIGILLIVQIPSA